MAYRQLWLELAVTPERPHETAESGVCIAMVELNAWCPERGLSDGGLFGLGHPPLDRVFTGNNPRVEKAVHPIVSGPQAGRSSSRQPSR